MTSENINNRAGTQLSKSHNFYIHSPIHFPENELFAITNYQ